MRNWRYWLAGTLVATAFVLIGGCGDERHEVKARETEHHGEVQEVEQGEMIVE